MHKDRLKALFAEQDSAIQTVISGVLSVEQEHISMQRPRVREQIDAIIDEVARRQLSRTVSSQ